MNNNITPEYHLMIDFETMGTDVRNCAIIQAAAVVFDINDMEGGLCDHIFIPHIGMYENLMYGRKVSEDTANWWKKRNPLVIDQWAYKSLSVAQNSGLQNLWAWIHTIQKAYDIRGVWSYGSTFDIMITKFLFPDFITHFRNERCLRTLVALFPGYIDTFQYRGEKHNALDDCLNQVRMCVDLTQRIKTLCIPEPFVPSHPEPEPPCHTEFSLSRACRGVEVQTLSDAN